MSSACKTPMKNLKEPQNKKIHNAKVQYYAEFLKRLFFQSKYMSLCKLCEEFLDELLDSLKLIVNKQRLLLDGSGDSLSPLAPIVEDDDEQCDSSGAGVAVKIMKIQEKLSMVEENDEAILERFNHKLKQSNEYLLRMNGENDKLKMLIKDVNERMNNLQNNKNNSQSKNLVKEQDGYVELLEKFESMQKHFQNLENNLRNLNIPEDQSQELEKLRNQLSQTSKSNLELETKLNKAERAIRDKGVLIESLTKQLLETEEKNGILIKERDTLQSQKNSAEARLKVLQSNVRNNEKDKDKMGSIMLEKDHYISKLEYENKGLESSLDHEKKMSARKLEEINGSLKELNKMIKLKDSEIESLRNLCSEYQEENQKLMKNIIENEKEIHIVEIKYSETKSAYEKLRDDFEDKLRTKVEEDFKDVMAFLEEKEDEIERLRNIIHDKDREVNYISETENKKLIDMEDVVYNLAKELREKDKENEELKCFIEDYRRVIGSVHELRDYPSKIPY